MKTYDVILVTDTHGYDFYNVFFKLKSPLKVWERGTGAHRIASHLRLNGFSVLVVDFSSHLTFSVWKNICKYAIGENTKLLGFSTTWWPYRSDMEINLIKDDSVKVQNNEKLTAAAETGKLQPWLQIAKEHNNKIKIVLGGSKIANYFDVQADHFFLGLGESQILDFMTQPKRIWPKIISHDVEASNFKFTCSNTFYEAESFIQPYETLGIELSRGCKFKCSFCRYPLIGRKDIAGYVKSSESIYSELMENYNKWGVTSYNILDDTLNDSTEKLTIIANAIKRLPFKPKFWSYTRIDMIYNNPEQINLLHEIGLVQTFMGIDNFHPVAAKVIGKGMDEQKRKNALYKCKEIWKDDITILGGYIVGLPHEPKDFVDTVFKWLKTKDCPIYFMNFRPLGILNSNNDIAKFSYKSMIDLNPDEYGYSIDYTQSNSIDAFWRKKDDTGISTYDDASKIAELYNNAQVQSILQRGQKPNFIYDEKMFKNPNWYFVALLHKLKNNLPL